MTRPDELTPEELEAALAAQPQPADIADDATVVADFDDALTRDGRSLVFGHGSVMLLSEVASAALAHAAGGITVAALGDALAAEFGAPPGDRDVALATRQIVAGLEGRRLLRRL